MFQYDEKKFFTELNKPVEPHCHEHHHYTMPEKVENISRELRHTLDRLMHFEKAITDKYNELMSNMTQDNVLFKEIMEKAWADFTAAVRTEVNLFETNTESVVALFKAAINTRLEEFNEAHGKEYDDYKAEVNALVGDAVAYMKTNLNTEVETLLREMEEAGTLVGIIETNLFTTPERYGAVGNGSSNDTTPFSEAFNNGNVIYLKANATYRVAAEIRLRSGMTIIGNGATVMFIGNDTTNCFVADNCRDIHVSNLKVTNGRSSPTFAFNMSKGSGCENITFRDVTIEGVNTLRNSGIFVGNVKELVVENCTFLSRYDEDSGETDCAITVWSDQQYNANSKYITIRGNRIQGFYRGINMWGTGTGSAGNRQLATIENNTIEGTKNEAIYAYHCPGSKIVNNFIMGCGRGIFADSSSDTDHDHYTNGNSKTNLVSGNSINTCEVGIYTEELESGIISNNILYKCAFGLVVGGGSNYLKISENGFNECGTALTLDMGYTANKYYINAPEIDGNTFVKTDKHCIHSLNCTSAIIKNNIFRLWGMLDTTTNQNRSSAIMIEQKAGYKYIVGNEFSNRVITTDETKGNPYACIADTACETYADLHICDNSFINALANMDIALINYSARRYFMNNRFDKDPVVSIKEGYETYYCHKNNNGLEDKALAE